MTTTKELNKITSRKALENELYRRLGPPKDCISGYVTAFLDSITAVLAERGEVKLKCFGTFERRIRKGRTYKHPTTGKDCVVEDTEKVVFSPSDYLNEKTQTKCD